MRDLYRRIRIPTGKRPVCLGESTKIRFLFYVNRKKKEMRKTEASKNLIPSLYFYIKLYLIYEKDTKRNKI